MQDAFDTLYNEWTNKGLFKSLVSKLQTPQEGRYEKAQASLIESIEVTEAIKVALLANGISPERFSVVDKAEAEAKEGDDVKVAMKLDVKN